MITLNVEQLSANGSSSTGLGGSYGFAMGPVIFGADVGYFSQSDTSSFSTLGYIGYGLGPYRMKDVRDPKNKFVAFGPAVGLYSSIYDGGSSDDP